MDFGQPSFGKKVLNNLIVTGLLGRGRKASVYSVRCITSNKNFALKVLSKGYEGRNLVPIALRKERNILLKITKERISYVTRLFAAFQSNNHVFFLMSIGSEGTIEDFLKYRRTFSEEEAKTYCCQILQALEGLHKLAIFHGAINTNNILFNNLEEATVSNFSLSYLVTVPRLTKRWRMRFTALQQKWLEAEKKTRASIDVAALGVLIDRMLYAPMNSKKRRNISEDCKDLINSLIQDCNQNPFQTVQDVKNHSWFDGVEWNNKSTPIGNPNRNTTVADGASAEVEDVEGTKSEDNNKDSQSQSDNEHRVLRKFCRYKKNDDLYFGKFKFAGMLAIYYFDYTDPEDNKYITDFDYVVPGDEYPF